MDKRNIAIFYDNGNNISNEKLDILAFLNSKRLLTNKGNSNLYETPKCDIHWVNVNKRNIKKFLENYEIEEIFCVDTDFEGKEQLIELRTRWSEVIKDKIKDIYGGKEKVYIPHYGYAEKRVVEAEMYVLDKHRECFGTKEEAEDFAVAKLKENNKEILKKIARLQEELRRNNEYIDKVEITRENNEHENN